MRYFGLAAACMSAGVLSACGPPANLQGAEGVNYANTTSGAFMGAATGAVLTGIATGGNASKAAAGAAVGAVVGGAIGNRLDRQAAELQQQLGNDAVRVENSGDQLLVSFPQEILFSPDSASVTSGQEQSVRALATNLNKYPDSNVQVIGHTDNTGEAGHNFDLSARRAGSVSSVLVSSGVSGSRVTATGRGEDAPIASNLTEEGRALNRRVEVVITPTT